ncbi:MAG: ABC transporter ATP-binding protein [Nitrospirota bacterium]
MMTMPVFELTGAGCSYPGSGLWAVRHLSLTVQPGEFLGVIGPNGSGKSTLLKLLSGFLRPHEGAVGFEGRPIGGYSARSLARRIAVVPQLGQFAFPFTVEEVVAMGRAPHQAALAPWSAPAPEDRAAIEEAMAQLELERLRDRSVLELSGGERQKVLVARALAQRTSVLLLDEPTASLDLHHQLAVYRLLRALNTNQRMTVVAVSHDLNLAALFSHRLALLEGGAVRRVGPPAEVLTQAELDALYGQAVVVDRHPLAAVPRVTVRP